MDRWLSNVMAVVPPVLAYVVVAVLATAESLFLGPVLPGELVQVLGGLLAFHGRVSLTAMLVLAAAGSIGGYLLAYAIGRRHGPALRTSRLGRRVGPARWAAVEKALVRRGARAILFGRLVGLLRAVMPMAAGMARMRFRTFAIYAVVGGLIWGPGSVLIGYRLADNQWIYHWKTTKAQAGYYWRIGATLDDGETSFVNIALD